MKSKIGVSEKERECFQRLVVCLRFQIEPKFRELNDEFEKTVDYAGVAAAVEEVAELNKARLLETLLSDIGDSLMERFPIRRLELQLKKFILPNARFVGVRSVWRARERPPLPYLKSKATVRKGYWRNSCVRARNSLDGFSKTRVIRRGSCKAIGPIKIQTNTDL